MNPKKSRQRIYQEKRKALGLCINCGKEKSVGIYCKECGIKNRERNRKKKNNKAWVSGGRGRKPIY